jgi:hypothetical protein
MTTDYSKLDTAALVQAADALMAEITPGAWYMDDEYLSTRDANNNWVALVFPTHDGIVWKNDADAAFIAAAPALVRALLTRLRESYSPVYKFNVGDRVRVLPLPQTDGDNAVYVGWPTGLETTIIQRKPGLPVYVVEGGYRYHEDYLERVSNG